MEGNGVSGRLYTNMGTGILGLEMNLQPQNPQIHLQNHPQISPFNQQQHEQQTQLSMKQSNYSYVVSNPNTNLNTNPPQKSKIQMTQFTNSDEDEGGCSNDHESNSIDGKRKRGVNGNSNSNSNSGSPWHRMKWTDNMVKLLIMAVYYIGDEVGGSEIGSEKKKPGSGGGAGNGSGLLQKKGKWKSVSKAMMEKGFSVSPQQCEDKFNDLNKRYKRVNDILGKGTACRVVENPNLLESMDLSSKMKEEVKKLLNSKHLFFREMCAYHNSCSHGTGGPTSDPVSAPSQNVDVQPNLTPSQVQQQQSCLHSTQMQQSIVLHNTPTNSHKVGLGTDNDVDDDDSDDDDEEDESDDEEEEEHEEGRARKKARTMQGSSPLASQRLSGEVMGLLQDSSMSSWEKKQWVKRQLVELEEQGVKFEIEALELEKQRLKWMKYSAKKEREMERMKIEIEMKKLESERMVLLLRRKEIELLQHSSNPPCLSSSTFSSDN